jgi:hypothetical protein
VSLPPWRFYYSLEIHSAPHSPLFAIAILNRIGSKKNKESRTPMYREKNKTACD